MQSASRPRFATGLAANAGYLGSLRPFSRRSIAHRVLRRFVLRARALPGLSGILESRTRHVAIDAEVEWCPVVDAEWLAGRFEQLGVATGRYRVDPDAFGAFLERARFPGWYYGGRTEAGRMFVEKALEHYVSSELLHLGAGDVYIDVGADNSPFAKIVRRIFGCESYQLDSAYRAGVHGGYIGCDVGAIPLPDASVDKMAAHCSFDHFQGPADRAFMHEVSRLLRPGGRFCIVPLYVAPEHSNFVDRRSWLSPPMLDSHARLIDVRNWGYEYTRYYSPETLLDLAASEAEVLTMTVYAIDGVTDVNPWCYLRTAAVFERRPSPKMYRAGVIHDSDSVL